LEDAFRESISDFSSTGAFDFEPFDDLTEFASELDRLLPEFVSERRFPNDFENEIVTVIDAAQSEMTCGEDSEDPEELRQRANALAHISAALDRVSTLSSLLALNAHNKSNEFAEGSSLLEQKASDCEPPEPEDYEADEHGRPSGYETFDVDALFSEL
jgi:hypothetical protein